MKHTLFWMIFCTWGIAIESLCLAISAKHDWMLFEAIFSVGLGISVLMLVVSVVTHHIRHDHPEV